MAFNTNRINYVKLKSVGPGAALLCWIIETPANNTKYKIQYTKYKLRTSKYKIQYKEYKILLAG